MSTDNEKLRNILAIGETVAVEFKRCGNGVSADTYETVCSFLNRYGGDIYLGVEDNGKVVGVPKNAAADIVKSVINAANNPDIISPTAYLSPEILDYEGKRIIRIHVLPSSEVHTCKKVVYDRAGEADVKVTATGAIAAMHIRKQNLFTEKKVFPYVKDSDLRLDMLPRIKQLAINRYQNHPWKDMSDKELIMSAKLYGKDGETGKNGYNLAAIMLLGRDEVILDVSPTHRTDALLRKVNVRRYDDRLLVITNLIDSYEQLMGFAEKHLPDKFYLEDDARISLRNAIVREMLVNTLIHREFTSPYTARFVIEKERMYTENASRAATYGLITPDNFQPNPKNPIIASFFRNIGFADDLGSGVRNLYYYGKRYSGKPPRIEEGDIFKIEVPLDDEYSFDARVGEAQAPTDLNRNDCGLNCGLNYGSNECVVLEYFKSNPTATQKEIAAAIGKSLRTVESAFATLKKKGILVREGAKKNGVWKINCVDDYEDI